MPTTFGDVDGKLALLKRDLAQIHYPHVFDQDGARLGQYKSLLPVISFVIHHLSRHVASLAVKYQLSGRRGKKYIEGVFKLARDEFKLRVVLRSAQFLADGFAERKLVFLHQMILASREYHSNMVRQHRFGLIITPPKKEEESEKKAKDTRLINTAADCGGFGSEASSSTGNALPGASQQSSKKENLSSKSIAERPLSTPQARSLPAQIHDQLERGSPDLYQYCPWQGTRIVVLPSPVVHFGLPEDLSGSEDEDESAYTINMENGTYYKLSLEDKGCHLPLFHMPLVARIEDLQKRLAQLEKQSAEANLRFYGYFTVLESRVIGLENQCWHHPASIADPMPPPASPWTNRAIQEPGHAAQFDGTSPRLQTSNESLCTAFSTPNAHKLCSNGSSSKSITGCHLGGDVFDILIGNEERSTAIDPEIVLKSLNSRLLEAQAALIQSQSEII